MKTFAEFIKILSMLTALGAVCWAGFVAISSAKEFGGDGDPSDALWTAGGVFLVACAVNVLAARFAKGMK
jgi:hypothetical protein